MIFFQVNDVPIAQPRQRHAVKFSKRLNRHFVQNYVPGSDPVQAWRELVQIQARQTYQGEPLARLPLSLHVTFLMPRPKSRKLPAERSWHISKPDTDNLTKAVKDALTGICWADDCLVCREIVSKQYAAQGEGPGVVVMIEVIV